MRSLSFVVAEDEPFILRSIIRKIRTVDPSSRILAAVSSGDAALEAVRRSSPDVLCTDIRMPVVDGLDLIKRARELLPGLRVIIVSGYSDFGFAQTAIELDVSHYLLKPLKSDDLRRAYRRIQSDLESSLREERRRCVLSALSLAPPDRAAENAFSSGLFHLFVAHIGHLDNRRFSAAGGTAEAAAARLPGLSDEWLRRLVESCGFEGEGWVAAGSERREVNFVLYEPHASSAGLTAIVEKTSEMLAETCGGCAVTVGFSAGPVALSALAPLRRQLLEMIKAGVVPGSSRTLRLDQGPSSTNPEWGISPGTRKELSVMARYRYEGELKTAVLRILASWERSACPQFWIERNLVELLRILHAESSAPSDEILRGAEQRVYDLLADAQDLHSIEEALWKALASALNGTGSLAGSEEVADRIKAFLDARYMDEVSMSNLCAELSISRSYASKAFKRHAGITPIEYLTRLRIEKARSLLQARPELRVQDVGEIVGYLDPHYFSRVFKKLTGVDPLHFRRPG
jgi:two-component system, response regulator YesN